MHATVQTLILARAEISRKSCSHIPIMLAINSLTLSVLIMLVSDSYTYIMCDIHITQQHS